MNVEIGVQKQRAATDLLPAIDGRRIRCVAFDAVGTLIYPSPPAGEVYFQAAQRHGSRLGAAEVADRFRNVFRETEQAPGPGGALWATSESHERERWRTIVARVIDDIPDPQACFDELFAWFALPAAWKMFDDVPATLTALSERGLRLAIASNFDARLHAVCDALPVLAPLGVRVISSEAGFRKPSRQFFEALLTAADCLPEELLMVGDDRENDLAGAARVGISGVLIDRRQTAPEALHSLSQLLTVELGLPK